MTNLKEMTSLDILEGLVYLLASWSYEKHPVFVLNSNLGIRIGQEHYIPTMSFNSNSKAVPVGIFGIEVEYNEFLPDDVIGITELTPSKAATWSPAKGYRDAMSVEAGKQWCSRLAEMLPESHGQFKFEDDDYYQI